MSLCSCSCTVIQTQGETDVVAFPWRTIVVASSSLYFSFPITFQLQRILRPLLPLLLLLLLLSAIHRFSLKDLFFRSICSSISSPFTLLGSSKLRVGTAWHKIFWRYLVRQARRCTVLPTEVEAVEAIFECLISFSKVGYPPYIHHLPQVHLLVSYWIKNINITSTPNFQRTSTSSTNTIPKASTSLLLPRLHSANHLTNL